MQIEAGFQAQILLSAHVRLRFQGKAGPTAPGKSPGPVRPDRLGTETGVSDRRRRAWTLPASLMPAGEFCRPSAPAPAAVAAVLTLAARNPSAIAEWQGPLTSPGQWRDSTRRGPGNSNCPMQAPAGGHHDSDPGAGAVKVHWHGPTCQRAFGAACGVRRRNF
jgi:hypothetical protein